MAAVLIRGEGIAGSCSSSLLREAGLSPALQRLGRPKLPAVMLGEATQRLLQDVFHREDLFAGIPQIRRRVVAWGRDSRPLTLPHSAVVVSEQELLDRIQRDLVPNPGPDFGPDFEEREDVKSAEPDWTIFASAPLRPSSIEHHFGSRIAAASPVELKPEADPETCWIESLESGWLFLLPTGKGTGWLLSVGASGESVLDASRLLRDQIAGIGHSQGTFPSHPRIVRPLSAPGWLACGTAAVGFDPLCGDGTGNAIREAILASAVVRAAVGGGDVASLVAHYETRLLEGFKRHLALCREFYRSGRSGLWWDNQLADLERGFAWCSEQLTDRPAFRYRLNEFELEPAQ